MPVRRDTRTLATPGAGPLLVGTPRRLERLPLGEEAKPGALTSGERRARVRSSLGGRACGVVKDWPSGCAPIGVRPTTDDPRLVLTATLHRGESSHWRLVPSTSSCTISVLASVCKCERKVQAPAA